MTLYFFATDEDVFSLAEWLIASEQFRIFEGYSRIDRPIRELHTVADFAAMHEGLPSILLRGWSPTFTTNPEFRRFKLNPAFGDHRTTLEGAAIVQIEGGRLVGENLYPACVSHWSEAGARARSVYPVEDLDEVNWANLRRASGRIGRAIKSRSSAKLRTCDGRGNTGT